MDQYADVLNYHTPFIKYLYKLTNAFFSDTFTINHLNFNPAIVKSHNGIFIDNILEERSYQYILNEKVNINKNNTNIIASCYFWMQNTMQYYERNYEKFQDLLSEIGGLSSFIFLFAKLFKQLIVRLSSQSLIKYTLLI